MTKGVSMTKGVFSVGSGREGKEAERMGEKGRGREK
jgi:hypothetical protein